MLNPTDLTRVLADLLNTGGHPAIRSTQLLPNGALKVLFGDGSEIYVKAAHVAPANGRTPDRPSWPAAAPMDPTDPTVVNTEPTVTGMRPGYFAALAVHLLTTAGRPEIAGAGTYADSGTVGAGWAPHGVRVTLATGQAVWLSIARGSAPTGDDKTMPDAGSAEGLRVLEPAG